MDLSFALRDGHPLYRYPFLLYQVLFSKNLYPFRKFFDPLFVLASIQKDVFLLSDLNEQAIYMSISDIRFTINFIKVLQIDASPIIKNNSNGHLLLSCYIQYHVRLKVFSRLSIFYMCVFAHALDMWNDFTQFSISELALIIGDQSQLKSVSIVFTFALVKGKASTP